MGSRVVGGALAALGVTVALAVTAGPGSVSSEGRRDEPGVALAATAAVPDAPSREARGAGHGSLVSSAPFDRALTLQRATNSLLRYRQVAVGGGSTTSTAVLSVPEGTPPDGGWPVLVQAHGTTGMADRCAPSRQPRDPGDTGDRSSDPMQGYVDAGYAVLRPDYEGLAGAGLHPWLIGRSEGRALLDAALAAGEADPSLSSSTVLVGFSQGGHAVLFAAAMAPRYAPDLEVLGTAAIAPVSDYAERVERRSWNPDGGPGPGELVMLAAATTTVDPDIRPRRLLGREARAHYDDVVEGCLEDVDAPDGLGGVPIEEVFRPRADLSRVLAVLRTSEPRRLTILTPVLVTQGEDDVTVAPPATAEVVEVLRGRGGDVTYETYPGVGHGDVTEASAEDVRAFLRALVGR